MILNSKDMSNTYLFIGKLCVYIKINVHLKIEIQQILILSYCNSNIYFADTFQETT